MLFLWLKAFHVVFMVTWFAGLFYLPRLFVYHADCKDEIGDQRFKIMERKLFAIMTIGAVLTLIFGLAMLFIRGWTLYATQIWLHIKFSLVFLLFVYHVYCYHLVRVFRAGTNRYSHVFYRWFNEIPALLLIAIVCLVVIKPQSIW